MSFDDFHQEMSVRQKMINDIRFRKREFTSYEEGYFDAVLDVNHLDELSAEHVLFLQKLYKRLYQAKT